MGPASLLHLPLELLHQVLDYLPLSSVYRLGAVNRYFHRLVHQDQGYWKKRLQSAKQLRLLDYDTKLDSCKDSLNLGFLDGLIRDPCLNGYKELYLLYSSEFQQDLRQIRRQQSDRSEIEKIVRHFFSRIRLHPWPKSQFTDPSLTARCALFGPGIESPRTKHLVHRMVNAPDDVFKAVNFVPGLPGGFGSGVRIDFKRMFTLDLICLCTNSERIHESQQGLERLLSFVGDECHLPNGRIERPELHQNVIRLLPTLHSVVFAIDATSPDDLNNLCQTRSWKKELFSMINGIRLGCRDKCPPPFLILCCSLGATNHICCWRLARSLGLEDVSVPWAMFVVDLSKTQGLEAGFDWLLYHIQKKRVDSEYHHFQGRS